MNRLLTFLFLVSSTTLFAQDQKQVDSLDFCSVKFQVPAGCKAESEYQVHCNDYSMVWLYMNNEMFKANLPEQFINQMEGQMKKFKKEPIVVYLLDNQVKGYKTSYKKENGTGHQIVAYGIINGRPVLVQLSLNSEAKTNTDIPEFPRQIVKLTK